MDHIFELNKTFNQLNVLLPCLILENILNMSKKFLYFTRKQ